MERILHLEANLLCIKGATKVVSSSATQAVIDIGENCIVLVGEKIEVKSLNLEENEVCLFGEFSSIKFTQAAGKKGSFLKRIFK